MLGNYNDDVGPFDMTAICSNITDCLHCLATACVWSKDANICAQETNNRDTKWLTPGRLSKFCFSDYNTEKNATVTVPCHYSNISDNLRVLYGVPSSHPPAQTHDNWNNPVSLSLLLLLAILIAANILYMIWKISRRLLPKYRRRRRQRNLFPLSESDLGEVDIHVERY